MPVSGVGRGGNRIPQISTPSISRTVPSTPVGSVHTSRSAADGFEAHKGGKTELSPAVREKAENQLNAFNTKLRSILHHDAMSLAAGHTPVRAGDTLSEAQNKALLNASKDLFMGLPIGSLSPAATNELKGFLKSQGISTDNLESKTLSDLGDIGGDLAKKWADNLKDKSPATFYGLLGAAGAAVGAYGYLEGSDALKKLGIKPEFKTKFFNDQISVRAEAMWDAKFRNANIAGDINGNVSLSKSSALSLRFQSHLNARDLDATTGSAALRWGDNKTHLDLGLKADASGITDYHLGGRATMNNVTVHGRANFDGDLDFTGGQLGGKIDFGNHGSSYLNVDFNGDGRASSLTGGIQYSRDKFNLKGSVRSDLINNYTSAELSAGYRPTDNLELGLKGSYNSETGGRVGLGLTWNF